MGVLMLVVITYRQFFLPPIAGARKEGDPRLTRRLLGAFCCHRRGPWCARNDPESNPEQQLGALPCHCGGRCLASSCPQTATTALGTFFCHPKSPGTRKAMIGSGLASNSCNASGRFVTTVVSDVRKEGALKLAGSLWKPYLAADAP
jgi:hypothetical protein